MHYDFEANIMSIEITKGNISFAKEFGKFIVHFSNAGKPILIEILDASKFVGQIDKLKNIKEIKKIALAN